ncbi:MAG: amino acid adenylation domain-containing protein, partial [Cyanobacteria bacterium J06649_11]
VLVGIYLDRSLDMVAGILGILKAGGAYVPLDPSHPFERLQLILDDAQLRVVLTQTSLLPELKQNQEKTNRLLIDLHSLEEVVNCEVPLLAPSGSTLSSDLAYVIYTSGSTGKPKGVQITHHSVVNFLTSIQRQLNLSGDETFLAVTTIAFDISILEIFLPLTIGATLVLANSENAKNGVRLMEMLTRFEIDIMQATPTTWQMLLNSGWQGMPNFKALCGGEALSKELAVQLLKQGIDLWNMYGPTETTIWSTLCQIDQDFQTISIGRPIDNTEVYILDSHLNPVPIGVPGELLIGGHGLAKGYLNRPDLTAAKFIQHPFSPVPEARLYKTGDLVRYMPNGVIEYIGRNDSQVKIRGYRIELGEIEAVIQQYPAVEMAIVMVSEYAINDKRLVAYVVINKLDETLPEQDLVWEDQLQIYLKEKLPSYMVPTDWAILDALPLTPNGKINRKLLPKVNDLRPRNGKKQELPKTDLEKSIVDIWEKALKRAQISVQDNFFDLGGHSLLVIQVHDSLSKDLNVDVDLLDLFKYPTVQTLANYLSNKPSKLLQVSAGNERAKKRQAARHKRKQLKAQTNN